MVSTFTPSQPHNSIGPGLTGILHVDPALAGGPFTWLASVTVPPFPSPPFWRQRSTSSFGAGSDVNVTLGINADPLLLEDNSGYAARADDATTLTLQIQDSSLITQETVTQTVNWDPTSGLGLLSSIQGQAGGFTSGDRAQLAAIETSTTNVLGSTGITIQSAAGTVVKTVSDFFGGFSLDKLTLNEISPGCTGAPVTFNIGNTIYQGVIVRICTFPPNWLPHTPDRSWFYPDFAVLSVFRGTDGMERVPIHTPSTIHFFKGYGGPVAGLITDLTLGFEPPLTSIEVDWAPGVTGQVYLMVLP